MILKEVSYLIKDAFILSKYSKNINIVKYYYNKKTVFYFITF